MELNSPISRFLIVLAAFIVVVAGMKAAESLLVPFFLSMFIAIVSSPPLLWMKDKGLPTWLSMLIIVLILVLIGLGVGAIIGSSISNFRQDLPEYQVKLSAMSTNLFERIQSFGVSIDLEQIKETFNPSKALAMAGNTLASFGNIMTNFFLILITVIFILAEEVGFADKLSRSPKTRKSLSAIHKFTRSVNQYVAIKTAMSLVTGLIVLVWLWVMDLDYFVLWGLLAFLLNFIPTIGSILAAIPPILLALVQLGIGEAGLVGLAFLAVNAGIGNFLEPRVMGKGLDLSALVVFLSLVFWGWVLGPVGMLLSIPLTMTVKIALESSEETRWIGLMLGSGREARQSALALLAENTDLGENTRKDADFDR